MIEQLTRQIILQYADMKNEIHSMQKDIVKTEDSIAQLLEEGVVQDKVMGGEGGIQGFKIEGFPQREYNRRRMLLMNKHNRLIKRENELIELKEDIETWIDGINNSRDRQILRKLVFENRTHQEIADEMYIDRSLVGKILTKYTDFPTIPKKSMI